MLELVDWATFCPVSKNDKHCVCFREGDGTGKFICCECERERTPVSIPIT